jgi:hypothetical protein
LKNITSFEWILKCQKAFEELKESLTPKILSQPRENKSMLLYLGVSNQVISLGCLKRKRVYKLPIYYSSGILHNAETRNLKVEMVALALVSAFRKLKSYFQAHQIIVLTYQHL